MQLEASGHGYSAGREIRGLSDLLAKTGSIQLVATEAAQNALTSAQEFRWGDVFMGFKYQNKGGKLFANGRSIGDINDENEIGGDRMGRVMGALNQMVSDKSINESIVVSEDLGYGRHFIYRYRRGEGDEIEGLAFEYQGTKEELGEIVSQLGRRAINHDEAILRNATDFSQPLFFTKENKNDISDLSKAAVDSFRTDERRVEMDSYLNRLKRDTEGYEELKLKRQQQERELEKQYEKIILKNDNARIGIANAVYGMLNVTERMAVSEDRRREESIRPAFVAQIKEDTSPVKDLMRTLPGAVDHTGRLSDQDEVMRIDSDNVNIVKDNKSQEQNTLSIELITQHVIEPAVTGIIGLLPLIGSIPVDMPDKMMSETTGVIDDNPDKLLVSIREQTGDFSEEEQIWTVAEEKSFSDMIAGFIPIIHKDNLGEPQQNENREAFKVFKSEFQHGLEVVAGLFSDGIRIEFDDKQRNAEKTGQSKVETEVVEFGEEIIGIVLKSENILRLSKDQQFKPQLDAIVQLSLLLHVYNEENSSEEIKSLLTPLIFWQIKEVRKDNLMLEQFPQLSLLFFNFDDLNEKAGFLDDRFFVLVERLEKVMQVKILDKSSVEIDMGELMKKVLILIYYLSKKQNRVRKSYKENIIYSPEILTNKQLANYKFVLPNKKKKQKYLDILSRYGIIYQYNYHIAYKAIFMPE